MQTAMPSTQLDLADMNPHHEWASSSSVVPTFDVAEGFSAAGLNALRGRLSEEVQAGRLPGAVVALWRHGQPAFQYAVGWLDAGARLPMRTDALFRIFSMTKPLVSVAAMLLVQDGVLSLDDEVQTHLPAFAHAGITVRDLLMHTSGLIYGQRQSAGPIRDAYLLHGVGVNPRGLDAAGLVHALSCVPLTGAPGTRWDYGNSTDLLGVLIEAVSRVRLGEFLRQRLFVLLGMHETGFVVPARHAARIAQPLPADPVDGSPLDNPNQTFDATEPPRLDTGGAGAISTAADYGRFANFLLAGGRTPEGRELLRAEFLAEMLRDHLTERGIRADPTPGESALNSPGYGFGYGFAVRLPGAVANLPGSPGSFLWSGTAGTLFWVDPELQLTAVYMTQAPGLSRQQYRRLIIELVYEAVS